MRRFLIIAWMLAGAARLQAAETLLTFPNVRLVEHAINDGDSFWVQTAATSFVVRLYFVDCPETTAHTDAMARRAHSQMRFFGLHDAHETFDYGHEARDVTRALLAEPFTVHTAYTHGGGSSGFPRYYAFVTLADGRDLARTLAAQGMARTFGVGRPTPYGETQAEAWDRLRDIEGAAMLRRAGIWNHSDPDRIVEGRAEQRREDETLREITRSMSDADPAARVNINRATREELERVAGIGPITAASIIAGRPYTNVSDLTRVRGIGPKLLAALQTSLTADDNPPTP